MNPWPCPEEDGPIDFSKKCKTSSYSDEDSPTDLSTNHSSSNNNNNTIANISSNSRSDDSSPSTVSLEDSTVGVRRASSTSRKKGRPLPEELKDEAYWERRRKNNEAAKRSRDARRAKEYEVSVKAQILESENLSLRLEISTLKDELTKLRACIMNPALQLQQMQQAILSGQNGAFRRLGRNAHLVHGRALSMVPVDGLDAEKEQDDEVEEQATQLKRW